MQHRSGFLKTDARGSHGLGLRTAAWWRSRRNRACVAAALIVFAAAPAFAQDGPSGQALELLNAARSAAGFSELSPSATLQAAAQAHAEDMAKRGYYAHETPEGKTARDRYVAAGGSEWKFVAENIAQCSRCDPAQPQATIRSFQDGWMDSPGHRRNIMARGIDSFGFGMASRAEKTYAVQLFAGPGTGEGGPHAAPASAEEVRRAAIAAVNTQREQTGLPPLETSPELDELARTIAQSTSLDGGELTLPRDPFDLMPDTRSRWTRLSTAARACGGCGTYPTVSDSETFAAGLARDKGAEVTHLGFALLADGDGRKIAIAVFGER